MDVNPAATDLARRCWLVSALWTQLYPAIDIAARLADLIGGFVPSPGYQG
ncbi:MAG: hypothetical protein H6651_20555 [Ardenticatenales bacterium]|nr:hypothetical protein [Ardenticatenales bacterium]